MPNTSLYQVARAIKRTRSSTYVEVAPNYDQRFSCQVAKRYCLYFAVNLLVTCAWISAVLILWLHYGQAVAGRSNSQQNDCRLINQSFKVKSINSENGEEKIVDWCPTQGDCKQSDVSAPEDGYYALVSDIHLYCPTRNTNIGDGLHKFGQLIKTSNDQRVQDVIQINVSKNDEHVTCYRSLIYMTFKLTEGEKIEVFVETPLSPGKVNSSSIIRLIDSKLTFYRIRDPLKCPRRFSHSISEMEDQANHHESSFSKIFNQRIYKSPKSLWSSSYLSTVNCNSSACKRYLVDGGSGYCLL